MEKSVYDFQKEIKQYMASRKKQDLNKIYNNLKDKYPLVMTNTFSLENGKEDYEEDFPILCGESNIGKFYLYDNGLYQIFDVEKTDGIAGHWHPKNDEEAINDIILFMQGVCKI